MAAAARYYDELETRAPEAREAAQFAALRALIARAKASAPGWTRILEDVDPESVSDRKALARLPLTRKSELPELQRAIPPLGGLITEAPGRLRRIFASPGPIYEGEGHARDGWRLARALFAAGFRAGDLVHNSFSYHLTPAGAMLEEGAAALGCAVVPGGVGQTELQLKCMADLKPIGYTGTPSFLKILFDKAAELTLDLSSLKKALVGAEALPPSLRAELEGHGMRVLQCYATADLGLVAYEYDAKDGLIVDEGVILELVRPGTGDPVEAGEVGEVVVSVLNPSYPLIRFALGDLSAYLPGISPCGRTAARIKGWLGRADQTTKVRGMFVRPSQIAEVAKRHPEIAKARLVVEQKDHLDVATLSCEIAGDAGPVLARAIGESFHSIAKVRATVTLTARGSLPNDGKVIEDARKYE